MKRLVQILAAVLVLASQADLLLSMGRGRDANGLLFALGMVSLIYLLARVLFPVFMSGGSVYPRESTANVSAWGPAVASARCSGRVGGLRFRGPLLRVTLHPEGLRIKPSLMEPVNIPLSRISGVRPSREGLMDGVEIQHASARDATPLFLACSYESELGRALKRTVGEAQAEPALRADGQER